MKKLNVLLSAVLLASSGMAAAGVLTVGTATGAAGTSIGPVSISFAGDGSTVGFQNDISYNEALLGQPTLTAQNSASCTRPSAGVIRVIKLDLGLTPLPGASTNYCDASFPVPGGTAAAVYPLTAANFATPPNGCSDAGGGTVVCTSVDGSVTVTGGGGPTTPPTIAYAPTTGTTINYAANGTAAPIVATPSGGSGAGAAATTTVGACTISGGGAAFPTTNIAQLSFIGATVTAQNINLPACVPQAGAATNATLTCPETQGVGAAVNRVWPLVCPQAAVAAVPPTLTYTPGTGSTTNVASAANFDIAVGCPTDGAACNGSGAGLAATSRLVSVAATYTGPPFSPLPFMSCSFVNEAGGNVASPLDFVATQADSGDVRCTCPVVTVAEPFTVTVVEQSPAGGASTNRQFNVVCGAGLTCGTITAAPASGTISLANGGAASTVSTVTLTGASAGVTQNVNCVQSNVSAGSTFTITGVPAALSSVTNSTTIAASCANSATTTGTATLTCTSTSNSPGCGLLSATYTLSCPGVNVPPPVTDFVPVPALNEQGRILLAALVLLLGLGVVGFRMRG